MRVNSGIRALVLATTVGLVAHGVAFAGAQVPSYPSSPKIAQEDEKHPCATKDRSEPGLQGQVPLSEQMSGDALLGYCKNVRYVGSNNIGGRNTSHNMAQLDSCAYVGDSGQLNEEPGGLAVVDVSKPAAPKLIKTFPGISGSPGTVHSNETRRIVLSKSGSGFAIFRIPRDCTKARVAGIYTSEQSSLHEFEISPDGKTVYAAFTIPDLNPATKALEIVDISDLANPKLIATWDPSEIYPGPETTAVHDLDINSDGTRIYIGTIFGPDIQSVMILDTSAIQQRKKDLTIRWISTMADAESHTLRLGRIRNRTYLFTGGELPTRATCPWVANEDVRQGVYIHDITDEKNPERVGVFSLEVNDPLNCPLTEPDNANYSLHFFSVDDPDNTKLLFASWYMSGLRVIDVRNPANPVEVGYYNSGSTAESFDSAYSYPRYIAQRKEIWFSAPTDGLQIVRLAMQK